MHATKLRAASVERSAVGTSILDAIGNTPIVELSRLNSNPKIRLLAKLEGTNPSGSVKDRVAKYLVEEFEAEQRARHNRFQQSQ